MKRFAFDLDKYQMDYLFSAFRGKSNIVSFWMHSVKIATAYAPPPAEMVCGVMVIQIDKMQRIFVQNGDKAFSAAFPFNIKEVDGILTCSLNSGIEITSKISTEVIAFLDATPAFLNGEILGFADDIMQTSDDPDELWKVLSELVCADDGYVRLDHDPAREKGKLHPLNHLDVFYSQGATFKLGLRAKIAVDDLSDILDLRSECHFLGQD